MHNGIIENFSELKTILEDQGYVFYSETDTEVVAKLFEYLFNGDSFKALKKLAAVVE